MTSEQARLHAKSLPADGVAHNFDRPRSWPIGQLLTGQRRHVTATIACAVLLALAACRQPPAAESTARAGVAARGGELVVSFRSEPASFNRHVGRDSSTNLVTLLTHARLVRVNLATQEVEPQLAESWTTSADGRRVTMALRRHVLFSDGQPFTSADVLFSFDAAYNPKSGSILADSIQAVGKNLQVEATDDYTIVITFPPRLDRASASSTCCRSIRGTSSRPRCRPARSTKPGG